MIEKVTGTTPAIQSFNKLENNTNEAVKQLQVQERQQEEVNKEPVTKEKMEDVVRGMNEFLSASNTHLKFEFHDKLKEYYVTIVDERSKEVIKEIPSKKVLDMFAAMTEFVGLMVDKKI
ncbi:flagellar protein FlaG [Rossellomorea vietnamensis]|uniref:Flagellar protein FlaG n=1 Tax=Rossellomorea vietnamensis TaxID=218284 RepID=A0ACD4C461_9BACI|nr:flagellar protein FlaG [Rossellomorea vietnamensis]UXH43439.1 flagellar protein FlaG [Rossellomorea vietnamensis]